jgi:hypothetical protein
LNCPELLEELEAKHKEEEEAEKTCRAMEDMSSSDNDETTDSDDDDPAYTPKTRKMDHSRKKEDVLGPEGTRGGNPLLIGCLSLIRFGSSFVRYCEITKW